jgi:hypothetical protein
MLHITNGDAAAERIASAGVTGEILPWRDVLHEGPVLPNLSLDELRGPRAQFIAERGWATLDQVTRDFERRDQALAAFHDHDQVVLWFEHDLYDQLQLIQLLDWFACQKLEDTRLSLICIDQYLGMLLPKHLSALYRTRHPVSPAELALGQQAWAAFRSPDPTQIVALVSEGTPVLPFLSGALGRHLEQFPSVKNGLSRSEAQALAVMAEGPITLGKAFKASHHDKEERLFLGDAVFAFYLERMSTATAPLLLFEDGTPVASPQRHEAEGFWQRRVVLTELGHAVQAGQEDWIRINGIDRWLGGVHLCGREATWRWDDASRQLRHILT